MIITLSSCHKCHLLNGLEAKYLKKSSWLDKRLARRRTILFRWSRLCSPANSEMRRGRGAGGLEGKEMWWGMMVKLRRSHLTILLLGVDQYGFMMRPQWLQEINTEHHPKVSQKIWTCHRPAVIAPECYGLCPQSGNTSNMKLTAICLYFYGSLFQFCLLCWQRRYWLDWPDKTVSPVQSVSGSVLTC